MLPASPASKLRATLIQLSLLDRQLILTLDHLVLVAQRPVSDFENVSLCYPAFIYAAQRD